MIHDGVQAEVGVRVRVHAALAGKQRGRQDAAVGSAPRVLFYPTLLYNVVRRWWDKIDQAPGSFSLS
jgi:hypothetical protein